MKIYKFKEDYIYNKDFHFEMSINLVIYYQSIVKKYNEAMEYEYVGISGKIFHSEEKEYKTKVKELKNEINVINKVIKGIVDTTTFDGDISEYIQEV